MSFPKLDIQEHYFSFCDDAYIPNTEHAHRPAICMFLLTPWSGFREQNLHYFLMFAWLILENSNVHFIPKSLVPSGG